MFEYYIRDCYTGEEMVIDGYDFEDACYEYGIDPLLCRGLVGRIYRLICFLSGMKKGQNYSKIFDPFVLRVNFYKI